MNLVSTNWKRREFGKRAWNESGLLGSKSELLLIVLMKLERWKVEKRGSDPCRGTAPY